MEQKEAEQWISIWDIFSEAVESLFWIINMSQEFFLLDTEEKTPIFFLTDLDENQTFGSEKRSEDNYFENNFMYVSFMNLLDKQNAIQNEEIHKQNEVCGENTFFQRELPTKEEFLEHYATFFMGKNVVWDREERGILGQQEEKYSDRNYFFKEDMFFGGKEYYLSILEQFQQGIESGTNWEKEDELLREGSIFPAMAPKSSSYGDIEEIMAEITQRLLEERSRSKKKVERWR